MAEEKKIQVVFMGKTYEIKPGEYDGLVDQVFKRLERYIKSLIDNNTHNQKVYREYLEQAKVKNGFFDAITQAVIVKAGGVKYPNDALAAASMKATVNLSRAQGSKDLKLLKVALPQAEQAINRFSADVMRFLSEFTGSAGTVATVLQVTSAASFAIVGALAVPVVITAGATAAGATVIVGGGVSVLQSAANELGNAASGQKVDLWQSVKTVALDGAIGVATAGIASKIPLGFVEKMSKGLAAKLVSKVPGLTAAQLQPFIVKFFQGTGEETIKTAVGEAIGVVGKIAKTGKAPTEKDFEEAVQKILMTAMTAGFMKNIASFQKKWAFDSRNAVEKTLIPSVLKDFLKGKKVPPVVMAKLQAEVWNKVSDEVTKGGITIALEVTKGTDDPDKLSKAAEAGILKDARTQKLIEKEVEKFLKKEKII